MRKPPYAYRNGALQWPAAVVMLAGCGIGLAIALDPKAPAYLGGIVGCAVSYLAWVIGWQSSVRLRADGVEISNMFVSSFVPWESFREFRVADGLRIVCADGRVIGSFAFGGSVLGQLTGYRRLKRTVQHMETSRQALTAERGLPDVPAAGPRHTVPTASRLGVHIEVWPLLAFALPLEFIGFLAAVLR